MKISIFILLIGCTSFINAQVTEGSLSNATPLLVNPAFTGTANSLRLNYGGALINPSLSSSGNFNYLAADLPVQKLHGAVGLQLYNAQFVGGNINETTAALSYSFLQQIGSKYALSIGTSLGIEREYANYFSGPGSQFPQQSEARYLPTADLGASFYSDRFFVQTSVSRRVNQYYFFTEISNLLQAQVGYKITPFSNKKLNFLPTAQWSINRGFQSIIAQLAFNTPYFSIGSSLSIRDNYAIFAGVYIKQFSLKYAYSRVSSKLSNGSGGTHNMALRYNFGVQQNTNIPRFNFELF